MSIPAILGPNATSGRPRRAVIALGDWGNAAVWTANLPPETGTTLEDLTSEQPSDFVGFDVSGGPLVLLGQADELDLDVVSIILANATTAATIAVDVGNSVGEAAGTQAQDASGFGRDGTLHGAPTFVQGKYGGALAFDGSDDQYLELPSIDTVSWTWMAWVRLAALPGQAITLLYQPGDDAETVGIERTIGVGLAGELLFDDGRGGNFSSTTPLVPGDLWYHVAVTYDAATQTVTMVLDGEDVGTNGATAYNDGVPDTFEPMQVGGNAGGFSLLGALDDVRFYGRALTVAEIGAEMQSEVCGLPADLLGQWRLNGYHSGTRTFGMPPNRPARPGKDDRRSSFLLLPYRMANQCVRITISDPTNPEPLRLGVVVVGPGDQPSEQNYSEDYALTATDDTKQTRTPTSQTMIDPREVVRGLEFTFENVPREEALIVWLDQYQWRTGTSEPVVVCLDPEAEDSMDAFFCYGPLRELSDARPPWYDGWRLQWSVGRLL